MKKTVEKIGEGGGEIRIPLFGGNGDRTYAQLLQLRKMFRQRDRAECGTKTVRAGSIAKALQAGAGTNSRGIAPFYTKTGHAAGKSAADAGESEDQDFALDEAAMRDPFDPIPTELRRKQQP